MLPSITFRSYQHLLILVGIFVLPSVVSGQNTAPQIAFVDGFLDGKWGQVGQDIGGEADDDSAGAAVALSADGKTAIIGAPGNDGSGSRQGHARIYSFDESLMTWVQLGQDIDGEESGDFSGGAVDISADGSIVVVGAARNDGIATATGHARVYQFDEGGKTWIQLGEDIEGDFAHDHFGQSVSLSSDGFTVAIGAKGNGIARPRAGYARVFSFDENTNSWSQVGQDLAGDVDNDQTGDGVALSSDGRTVAVGATWSDANGVDSGHVRVFLFEDSLGEWVQRGADIPGEAAGDEFGGVVAIDSEGNTLIAGATGNDNIGPNAGHARVFRFDLDSGVWEQVGQDLDGESQFDEAGRGVDISADGKAVVVGAVGVFVGGFEHSYARVYRFEEDLGRWRTIHRAQDGSTFADGVRMGVALNDDGLTVITGTTDSDEGRTRIFRLDPIQYYPFAEDSLVVTDVDVSDDFDSEGEGIVFSLAGVDVDFFSVDQSGVLSFKGLPDFENPLDRNRDNIYEVTIVAKDSGQLAGEGPVEVEVASRVPEISGAYDIFLERSQDSSLKFFLKDLDTDVSSLAISAVSDNQSLIDDASLMFTGDGEIRLLAIVPETGQTGSAKITVTASDGSNSVVSSFVVTVRNGMPELSFVDGVLSEEWEQVGQTIEGENVNDHFGGAVGVSPDGRTVVMGAVGNDGNGSVSGHARVYSINAEGNSWMQLGLDIEGMAGDFFGNATALSADGRSVIVGASRSDGSRRVTDVGKATAYRYNEGQGFWVRSGQNIEGVFRGDRLGESVGLSADGFTSVVGSLGSDGNGVASGSITVLQFDTERGEWIQLGQRIDGEVGGDGFGGSVALSANGRTVAAGATGNDGNGSFAGHVRVFHYDESQSLWTQLGQDLDGEEAGDSSGQSISLSADGRTVIIGASSNKGNGSEAGHGRIYRFDHREGRWLQLGEDIDGERAWDQQRAVGISGDGLTTILGSTGHDGFVQNAGHVRIFRFDQDAAAWVQLGEAIDGTSGLNFGEAVALDSDGTTAVIGTSRGGSAGLAEIYRFSSVQKISMIEKRTVVTDVAGADDVDIEGAGLSYSLSGVDSPLFSVSSSGVISFNTSPDFDSPVDANGDNRYEFTIVATDADQGSAQHDIEVSILSNEPSILGAFDVYLRRNEESGIALSLMDLDTAFEALTVTAISSNQALIEDSSLIFSGVGADRELMIVPVADVVGSARITVTVDDGETLSTVNFVVRVDNQAPRLSFDGGIHLEEWKQVGSDINGEASFDQSGHSVALSADGNSAIVGALFNRDNGSQAGHARIFGFDEGGEDWTQLGQDIDGEEAGDWAGSAVALSADGRTALMGADRHDGNGVNAGHARAFTFDESSEMWVQLGQAIEGESAGDLTGEAVALSADGRTAIVGGWANDGNGTSAGHARIFSFDESSGLWTQVGQELNGEVEGDNFGGSVALSADGRTAIIGAPGHDANGEASGHAKVFQFVDHLEQWVQLGGDIEGQREADRLGVSVGLDASGRVAIVGVPFSDEVADSSGHCAVYRLDPQSGDWTQVGQDMVGEDVFDGLGGAVALSSDGGIALAGTGRSAQGYARSYRYDEDGRAWIPLGQIVEGEAEDDAAGRAVALNADGRKMIVGARSNDGNGSLSGHARAFELFSVHQLHVGDGATFVADVTASDDLDAEGAGITFALVGVDAEYFEVDPSGVLIFKQAASLNLPRDNGADNAYDVTLVVTDSELAEIRQDVQVVVSGPTDIAVSIDLLQVPLVAGGEPLSVFYVTATNNGPFHATNVVVAQSVDFPASTSLVSAKVSHGVYDAGEWRFNLPVGMSASLVLTVEAYEGAASGLEAFPIGFAFMQSDQGDPISANDSALALAPIISDNDVILSATLPVFDDLRQRFISTVSLLNEEGVEIPAARVLVSGLPDDVAVSNADGVSAEGAYIYLNSPLDSEEEGEVEFEFTTSNPAANFTPFYMVEPLSSPEVLGHQAGNISVLNHSTLVSGAQFLEFLTLKGATYAIEYSEDLLRWNRVEEEVMAGSSRLFWIDEGAPATLSHPTDAQKRYYRCVLVSLPVSE